MSAGRGGSRSRRVAEWSSLPAPPSLAAAGALAGSGGGARHELPRRRHPGLLRRVRTPAVGDRLFAVARPCLRARRSRQSRAASPRRCAGCAASATRRLAARQPRPAPARRRRGREAHHERHVDELLGAADRDALLDWLRQPHGGARAWLADGARRRRAAMGPRDTTLRARRRSRAGAARSALRDFMQVMSGNEPARWSDSLTGDARLRFIINVLTRMRFVAADGTLEFAAKDGAERRAARLLPVVRRTGPPHRAHADRLRPLVHARPDRPRGPARARHRLRMGRPAHRRPHRRGPTRIDSGAVQGPRRR